MKIGRQLRRQGTMHKEGKSKGTEESKEKATKKADRTLEPRTGSRKERRQK